MDKADAKDLESFDASTCCLGIRIASNQNESEAGMNLIRRLAMIDVTGQATSDLLSSLPAVDSQRVATAILTSPEPNADRHPSPNALEATARWAARTERWSLLASAAEEHQPSMAELTKSATVESIFAESLMQVGRIEASKVWWDHLVDVRSVEDFATLIRCAETETSVGHDTDLAQRRIDAARRAAGDDEFQTALANMLAAELLIRRTKFDDARSTLDSIVRTTDGDASIRSRAQWLIGETHYLQHHFSAAIDAYRRVEEIAGEAERCGQWVSASLVQAGKSFEQLGRTREAALCYRNLLDRFPDSAHARLARQRVAVLAPEQRYDDAPDSSQTIRR
jgi:predicted negative regulator of RcsB-dependent stress response